MHFPCNYSKLLNKTKKYTRILTLFVHFFTSLNPKLEGVSLGEQMSGFELGFFVRRNECRLWKRRNKELWGNTVNSNVCIAQYCTRDIVQCKIQNKNVHLSYVSSLLCKISLNIHMNSSHQAAITLSTSCEVSSNKRSFNFPPYSMQRATKHSEQKISMLHTTFTTITHKNISQSYAQQLPP
jgi:hypothetical protein